MSIAEKFPDLTPEEISMQLIVRACERYPQPPTGMSARALLDRMQDLGLIRWETEDGKIFAVETPAGKAVRP